MSKQAQYILFGEDVIGNVSAYPAYPPIHCVGCGSELYRVYNSDTQWKYVCLKEKLLVVPENQFRTLEIEIE